MSNKVPPPMPEINRLRAAALIPIIESGLLASRISIERAALMAAFCEWVVEKPFYEHDAAKLAVSIGNGLKRFKVALECGRMRNAER